MLHFVILEAIDCSHKLGFAKRNSQDLGPPRAKGELPGKGQPKLGQKSGSKLLLLRGKIENAEGDLEKDPFEMALFCSLKWECKQCSQHCVSLYCFNGELNLGVMATSVSDLGSKIGFLKIWEVELRGTFWFLEGSCAMA